MPRRAVPILLVMATGVAGCANPSQLKTVLEYQPGGGTSTTAVKYDATYALHSLDRPEGNNPVVTVDLKQGAQIGSRSEEDTIFAVAGDKATPIPGGGYVWRVTPETEMGAWKRFTTSVGDECKKACVSVVLIFYYPLIIVQNARTGCWFSSWLM